MYSLAEAISVKEDWGHSSNIVGRRAVPDGAAPSTCACSITSPSSTMRRIDARARRDAPARGDHARRPAVESGGLRRDGNRALSFAARARCTGRRGAWVRVRCGRRGQPLGVALLLVAARARARTRPVRTRRSSACGVRRLPAAGAARTPSAPAIDRRRSTRRACAAHRPVAVAADLARRARGRESTAAGPAAIGIDILMPEADALSPERLLARDA